MVGIFENKIIRKINNFLHGNEKIKIQTFDKMEKFNLFYFKAGTE